MTHKKEPHRPHRDRSCTARAALGALALFLSAAGPASAQEGEAVCVEGEVTALAYADHTAGCAISPGSDIDNFAFDGATGDVVRIIIHSTSSNAYDPRMELYDCGFALIEQAQCANNQCTTFIETTLQCDGSHTLLVSDSGSDETGNYTLQLERISPPMDTTSLEYGAVYSDVISPGTDMDRFRFYGQPGTVARLAIHSTTSNAFDPRVEILDPSGNRIDDTSCSNNGCAFRLVPGLDQTGYYAVLVSDLFSNEVGGYSLSMQCVYGPCDSDGDGTADPEPPVLPYDTPTAAAVSADVAMVSFRFPVIAGTANRLAVHSSTSNAFDPQLELLDSGGTVVAEQDCSNNGCSFAIAIDALQNDVLTVHITDVGSNEVGGFNINLQCRTGPCDSDQDGVTDPQDTEASYLHNDGSFRHTVQSDVDVVPLYFNGLAGTVARLSLHSVTSNAFDPVMDVFDPLGDLVITALCNNNGCSFSEQLELQETGIYTLVVYDNVLNEPGGFDINLQCVLGICDSDDDGVLDGDPLILPFDTIRSDVIDPGVDVDQFAFLGETGIPLRITVDSTTSNAFDPNLELIGPDGATALVQSCQNNGCAFTFDYTPTMTGLHQIVMSDVGLDEVGGFDLRVGCLFANCSAPPAPPLDRDNCEWVANGPDRPDAGGNIQRDTNADGYGNACDPDLNDDGTVTFDDLGQMKSVFFTNDITADLDGDGVVGFTDLGRMKQLFFASPGPSGLQCAGNVPCP